MPEFARHYLGYLLARCSYEVSAAFHAKLKDAGVSVLTWRTLSSIRDRPDTVNELAKKVLVTQSTLSKALDRMERDNLIKRERDPDFLSKTNITITDDGIQLIDQLTDIANQFEGDSIKLLSEAELQELKLLLRKLIGDVD